VYAAVLYYNIFSHQQRRQRRRYRSYPADHRTEGHHGGSYVGRKYLRGQDVGDAERDGYAQFNGHEQRRLYQMPSCPKRKRQKYKEVYKNTLRKRQILTVL